MTHFKKALGGLAVVGLLAAAAPATAGAILSFNTANYGTQTVDPFGSFDWAQQGSALSTGFNTGAGIGVEGTEFTTVFMSTATTVDFAGGGVALDGAEGLNQTDGYEFTIFATITETANCLARDGFGNCTTALFTATGGSYNIYYQETPNANLGTGAGIADGTLVITGEMGAGFAGTFSTFLFGGEPSGSGVFNFTGGITYTNSAFINPDLDTGSTVSTIQFGGTTTGWTQPTSFSNGLDGGTVALPDLNPALGTNFLFQADANTAFTATAVPEPGTLALLGLGLLGVAGGTWRRRQS